MLAHNLKEHSTFYVFKQRIMAKRSKSYSNFKQEDLRALQIEMVSEPLFPQHINPLPASEWLKVTLDRNLRFPLGTEKAKSEFIVAPILAELHDHNGGSFTCFSGVTLDVDKQLGLSGRSDFILSHKPKAVVLEAPIFSIIEAKHDNIEEAYAQCVAQLYAASLFNSQRKTVFPFLYGAVTTGFLWKFIRYENKVAFVDTDLFYLESVDDLLGVLQHIIGQFKG